MAYNKYRVSPKAERTHNGEIFDSKKELQYYLRLEQLKRAAFVSERVDKIERQVKYDFILDGEKICDYILDFKVKYGDGRIEYVDVKGYKAGAAWTMFRIKQKCMKAFYGIEVKVV